MSEIRVTTLTDTSGSNSSTTAQIASGRAKAWVNFNGSSTVAIRANFNVNSITDNGVGDYTVNLTTSVSDGNGSVVLTTQQIAYANVYAPVPPTSSAIRIQISSTAASNIDLPYVFLSLFR